ncbi:hypothetical protein PR048_027419 [Dryococelus australis]|uniref:Uncharacterized protein n=1 Tax=Dryococelus australis TaxID=614101 RepID=A0ABQ9GFF0_9NEOP|nr:hypothetical protein PR048_027419 [Dryococelus australis]
MTLSKYPYAPYHPSPKCKVLVIIYPSYLRFSFFATNSRWRRLYTGVQMAPEVPAPPPHLPRPPSPERVTFSETKTVCLSDYLPSCSEVSMERHRNERAGEAGDPRENTSTNGIVRHDSHMRKSGVTRPGLNPDRLGKSPAERLHALRVETTRRVISEEEYTLRAHAFRDVLTRKIAAVQAGGRAGGLAGGLETNRQQQALRRASALEPKKQVTSTALVEVDVASDVTITAEEVDGEKP